MGKLTVAKVKSLKVPGRYGDGHGLYLNIAPGASKSWVQRLVIRGRRRDMGLGSAEWVPLRAARERAYDNRRIARTGGDPRPERKRSTVPTFEVAAKATIAANRAGWRDAERTAAKWNRTLGVCAAGDLRHETGCQPKT